MADYKMRAAGPKAAEVFMYGAIGDDFGGVTAQQFAEDLKAFGKIDRINIRMNSPGGDVFQGLAIYNTLKRHPASVLIDIDGMALSIASIIAMAGDEIRMAGNASFMIHDPLSIVAGTAAEMRDKAAIMDQVKENLVGTYAKRTGLDAAALSQMMADETWLQARDALANGFIDKITEEIPMAASADLSSFKFRNAPKSLGKISAASRGNRIPGADLYRAKIQEMTRKVSG